MNAATRIPVQSCTVTRAGGPSHLCAEPKTFVGANAVSCASAWLFTQAGSCVGDDHDYAVIWTDGSEYDGKTCVHEDGRGVDLAARMREHLESVSGRRVPYGLTATMWARHLDRLPTGTRDGAAAMLDRLAI